MAMNYHGLAPVLDVDSLSNMVWLDDPTKYDYVRKSFYHVASDDGIRCSNDLKRWLKYHVLPDEYSRGSRSSVSQYVVGFEFDEDKFLNLGFIVGQYFYLKPYDTFFHPRHVCASYCSFGSVPYESVRFVGSCSGFLTPRSRRSVSRFRHKVFSRDGYRCVECGASNKDVRLEVDHIVPVSKGGLDSLDNLQTLCFVCNRGKFDDVWDDRKGEREQK